MERKRRGGERMKSRMKKWKGRRSGRGGGRENRKGKGWAHKVIFKA